MNMDAETETELQSAILEATSALNECVDVFIALAKRGQYPQELMGQGWQFAIDACAKLSAEYYRAWPPEDAGEDGGRAGKTLQSAPEKRQC
jgi:hypothetical protein